MKHLNNWKSFNEAQSYPQSIKFFVDLVSDKCQSLITDYLRSDEDDSQEVFTISYSQIKPYIDSNPELFKQFPVETIEVSLNLIGSDPNFNFKGVSKHIVSDESEGYKNSLSYLKTSESGLVDKSIYYRIALAVGIDKTDDSDVEYVRALLDDITNHEIQHGYDEYTRITKGLDTKSDYVFYNCVMLVAEDLSNHLDYSINPTLPLFLLSIYNCSETEIKSAVVEPGKNIKSIEDWSRILQKRNMDYNYDQMIDGLKKDADYNVYEAIPQIILNKYLLVCDQYDIKPSTKYINICKKDFESFAKYWVNTIKQKVDKIKRKSAKRILN
jgi:hypothetical protein